MEGKNLLERFFTPRNIALVGASNNAGKIGNVLVRNLSAGFSGNIYPVHPTEQEIAGLPAYPALAAIPEELDLVIPLVPSEQLHKLVEGCKKGQVKFMLAIPSGFGEVSAGGKALERELILLAKERDIRVVGPNTAGMLNCPYGLNASLLPELPLGGHGFSCVTQSGGFGMAIYMYSHDHRLPVAKICDLGNTADVSVNDLLDYFCHDIDTRVVGVFLESIADWEAFLAQANALAAIKPLILTKLGRTTAGSRASFAHIGIPDGAEMKEGETGSNVILAQTGLEMLNIAKALCWQPLPRGRRVGILTGSGGIGVELSDLCVERGLKVPEFSSQLQNTLRPYLPSYASVQNPVDLTPIWWEFPRVYPPLMEALFASAEIDLLIVAVLDVATTIDELMVAITETVRQIQPDVGSLKPLYVYWASRNNMMKNMAILEEAHIPCYRSTLETIRVAEAISRYGAFSSKRGY